MDKHKELKQRFRDLFGQKSHVTIDGVVKSINGDTCTVIVDDLELEDVRIKAVVDGSDSILIIPKEDSHVLMISTDGTIDNLTIIKCDKVSKIIYHQNGFYLEMDAETGKIELKNDTVSLKDLFQKSADIKKNMKVSTPMGPSGTPLPDVLLMIEDFETSFKALLK